jgi:AcrR family transcriptional regulator
MSAEPERFEPEALADPALATLPAGRHGLPRSVVSRNQHLRIVGAMLRALPEHGYAATTIGHLTRKAGVSREAFYAQFDSKQECFLVTYDLATEWLCKRIELAVDDDEEWPSRVRAGVSEALRLLAANPPLARLFAIEVLQAGAAARERQQACLTRFAKALRAGRPDRDELPPELEEMLLGGVMTTIGRYVDSGRTEQLPEATAELTEYLLIPYLGPEETKRIARAA